MRNGNGLWRIGLDYGTPQEVRRADPLRLLVRRRQAGPAFYRRFSRRSLPRGKIAAELLALAPPFAAAAELRRLCDAHQTKKHRGDRDSEFHYRFSQE